jgi:hypothetical protein
MGMLFLFVLQFIALLLAWFGYRKSAMGVFSASLIFSVIFFIHHMTDAVGLSL